MTSLKLIFKLFILMLLSLTGCTTMSPAAENEELTPVVVWTNGLTEAQIVETMPTNAGKVSDSPSDTDSTGDNAGDAYWISWQVPTGTLPRDGWKVYVRYQGNDTWIPIDPNTVDVVVETVTEDEGTYDKYTVEVPSSGDTQEDGDTDPDTTDTATQEDTEEPDSSEDSDSSVVVTYKVETEDSQGNDVGTEVSVVTVPPNHPVRVTLSDETNALAPSGVSAVYNGIVETLWPVSELTDRQLPQSLFLADTVSDASLLSFNITTDFSEYDFYEKRIVRSSSSSFCRVVEVPVDDDDVYRRLKFSFEDLPLSAVSYENGGAFDYNDVVLFVDIMNP